jgi:protein-S-isoprenylcysteine O-methyltransferase Ste14
VPELAVAFIVTYGALAFGLRALVQLRRTGSPGLVGLSGRFGSLEWLGGVLFALAIALSVTGAVAQAEGGLDPIDALDATAGHVAGAVLAGGGIVATLVAQFAMGDSWRVGVDPGERTELVTDGPFSLVRNPIFAAMIPFFAGIALLAPNALTIGGVVLLVLSLELQIRFVEEPHLSRVHGQRYDDYAARVGRFLPGVGRLGRN